MFNYYVYIYLNPLKEGDYYFNKFHFNYEPFYVGKGKNNRCNAHLTESKSKNKLKKNIISKIKNNNIKPIIIKLYENITEQSAFRIEKTLIKIIGRRDKNNGTLSNMTDGGEGTSGRIYTDDIRVNMLKTHENIIQYDVDGNIIEIWSNVIEIVKKYPYLKINHLHRACRSEGCRILDNYFWKYFEGENLKDKIKVVDKYRKIIQYDLNGNIIKEWQKSSDISNVGYSSGAILKCCRNNENNKKIYYKFKDYMWIFKDSDKEIKPYNFNSSKVNSKINKNKILKFTKNNDFLGEYKPIDLKDNFNIKSIYRCCNGELKTTQGFIWKWD